MEEVLHPFPFAFRGVGKKGKVYALDIHKLAINTVQRKIKKHSLKNIETILIDGYDSTLPNDTADVVCAIDMFLYVKKPTELLKEIKRITKKDGILIVDGIHETAIYVGVIGKKF